MLILRLLQSLINMWKLSAHSGYFWVVSPWWKSFFWSLKNDPQTDNKEPLLDRVYPVSCKICVSSTMGSCSFDISVSSKLKIGWLEEVMHALLGRVGNFEKGIQTSTWQTLLNFLNAIASLESLVFSFCDFVFLHVFYLLYFWHCLVLLVLFVAWVVFAVLMML